MTRLLRRLRFLLRRSRHEGELDDELQFHLEMKRSELESRGLDPAAAEVAARRALGNLPLTRERVRDVWIAPWLQSLLQDVRYGLRILRRDRGFAATAVGTLALGIGVNAAIFSVFSEVLVRPLPVHHPERLVNLEAPGPKGPARSCNMAGGCDEVFSYPMFRDLEREQTVFTHLAAHRTFLVTVSYRGQAINGQGAQVSGSYFPALGLRPSLGRLLGPETDEPVGGHPVVVLSHDYWQSDLGGPSDAVGDTLLVNGVPLTIVGVAPPGFHGTTFGLRPDVFVPISMHATLTGRSDALANRRDYWVYLFARLDPDVSIAQARAVLEPQYRGILTEVEAPLQVHMSARALEQFVAKPLPLRDGRRGQSTLDEATTAPLLLLFAVTGIVALITCANVANLLLARAAGRTSEMAVRLALGASRRRLLAQLLVESLTLAVLGGAAGLLVAQWTLRFIRALLPPEAGDLPLTLDPYVIPFVAAAAFVTGAIFGVFPSLHATRAGLIAGLKDEAGQLAGARSASRFRRGLAVAQVALAMTLLVTAGLCVQSLRNVSRVDLGVRSADVVVFRVWAGPSLGDPYLRALYERVETELAVRPGVAEVTAASNALVMDGMRATEVVVEGWAAEPNADRRTLFNRIGAGYFHTLGIPVLAGRTFTAADAHAAPRVAIVNEAFARKFGLGRDVVGRRVGRGGPDVEPDTEIVGLVANTKHQAARLPEQPFLYLPYRQEDSVSSLTFYLRTTLPPRELLGAVPALLASIDPNVAVTSVTTLEQRIRDSAVLDRTITLLSVGCAVLAALVATVGLYGVLTYSVAQRTREFGLRVALGADPARLRATVLGQVGRLTLLGGAVGTVGALGLGHVAQSLLYEIEGLPAPVIAAAVASLAVVALAAGFVPAHRAARINPTEALRHQ